MPEENLINTCEFLIKYYETLNNLLNSPINTTMTIIDSYPEEMEMRPKNLIKLKVNWSKEGF